MFTLSFDTGHFNIDVDYTRDLEVAAVTITNGSFMAEPNFRDLSTVLQEEITERCEEDLAERQLEDA